MKVAEREDRSVARRVGESVVISLAATAIVEGTAAGVKYAHGKYTDWREGRAKATARAERTERSKDGKGKKKKKKD